MMAAPAPKPKQHVLSDLASEITVVNASSVEITEKDAEPEGVGGQTTLFAHAQLSKLGVTRKDMRASL